MIHVKYRWHKRITVYMSDQCKYSDGDSEISEDSDEDLPEGW